MLRGLKTIGMALAGVAVMAGLGMSSGQATASEPLVVAPAVYQGSARPQVQLARYGYHRGYRYGGYGYGYRRGFYRPYYRPYYRPFIGVGVGVAPYGYGGYYGGYGYGW